MDIKVITISLAVLFIIIFLVNSYRKQMVFKKLQILLSKGEFDEYLSLLDSFMVKMLYPKYNWLYMKLNGYIFKEDHKHIDQLFTQMLAMRTSKKQRKDLVMKAFNYYIEQTNKKQTAVLLDEIDTWDNESQKQEAHRIYDIFILKKHNHIEEIEAMLKDTPDFQKGILEYLLSMQYENKGDKEMSQKYLEASRKHMFSSSEQKKASDEEKTNGE